MNQELGGREEQVDRDEGEDPTDECCCSEYCSPLSLSGLGKPEVGGEESVGVVHRDYSVRLDFSWI